MSWKVHIMRKLCKDFKKIFLHLHKLIFESHFSRIFWNSLVFLRSFPIGSAVVSLVRISLFLSRNMLSSDVGNDTSCAWAFRLRWTSAFRGRKGLWPPCVGNKQNWLLEPRTGITALLENHCGGESFVWKGSRRHLRPSMLCAKVLFLTLYEMGWCHYQKDFNFPV